jgi:glucose dehydrogenase
VNDCTDFLIIGGGIAGALLADRLVRKGKSVVLLEAGSRVNRDVAARSLAVSKDRSLKSPYADENFDFAPFPDKASDYGEGTSFKSTYMRRLGGSTWHWQGHTPRLLPSDFELCSRYGVGVDWPLGYDDLEPWYCQAEVELGVSGDHEAWNGFAGARRSKPFPMPPIWPSHGDRRVSEALEGLAVDGQSLLARPIPQARNSMPYDGRPPCAGNSTCIPLCPIGAKYDATVHVHRAEKRAPTPLVVHDLMQVVRLVIDGGRVTEVIAVDGRSPVRETRAFKADVFLVCAHAIETVRLLAASGLADASGQLGKNLMDHPTGQVVALAPWPVWPFRGPPATSGIDDLRDGRFRAKRAAMKFSLGNDGWGRFKTPEQIVAGRWISKVGFGAPLREKIVEEGPRLYRISWASEQLPVATNRLVPTGTFDAVGLPNLKLEYAVDDYTLASFPVARDVIHRLFERAQMSGVEEDADPKKYSGSGHILGTCRMGATSALGVVDDFGRAFSTENLFVVGSATFPTGGTANPTLTIAALALRTAARLGGAIDVE